MTTIEKQRLRVEEILRVFRPEAYAILKEATRAQKVRT